MENAINEALKKISEDPKYDRAVFQARGVYFVIGNGEIWEISDDAGCTPRGGWFPEIYTGLSEEKNKFIEECMEEYDIDEYFFDEMLEYLFEPDEEELLEYFEEQDEEDQLQIFKSMQSTVKKGKTPFDSIKELVTSFSRYGLEEDTLYYEWEGEHIDLHENIASYGEERGQIDNLTDEERLNILNNIDKYLVTRD